MSVVMLKMFFPTALVALSLACQPEPILDEHTPPQDSLPVLTVPSAPTTLAPLLGVNVTWANDQRIIGEEDIVDGAVRHVRYFQMMEKDYATGTPASVQLEPCLDLNNPWSCSDNSMKQHLVRVKQLRRMFPEGIIWIAPEVLDNRKWPCKGWSAAELGTDPETAGYRWGQAAFATYGQVPGVIVAMTNEEWCSGAERVNAYNAWRRGIIRAHRENPSCELAIGARHVRARTWKGERMPDNVMDVASDVWSYVEEVGGWADYHAHGIEQGRFLPHDRAHLATDYQDFFAWSQWLDEHYPNIRKSVGEIAYTTSNPDVVATDEQKRADFATYSQLVHRLAQEADLVFLYQLEDHAAAEGAFSGSGIYPALMDSVRSLGNAPRQAPD